MQQTTLDKEIKLKRIPLDIRNFYQNALGDLATSATFAVIYIVLCTLLNYTSLLLFKPNTIYTHNQPTKSFIFTMKIWDASLISKYSMETIR